MPSAGRAAVMVQSAWRGTFVRWFEVDMVLYRIASVVLQRAWRRYAKRRVRGWTRAATTRGRQHDGGDDGGDGYSDDGRERGDFERRVAPGAEGEEYDYNGPDGGGGGGGGDGDFDDFDDSDDDLYEDDDEEVGVGFYFFVKKITNSFIEYAFAANFALAPLGSSIRSSTKCRAVARRCSGRSSRHRGPR